MSLGRAFTILWSANAASNLADGLAFISMPLLAASLTDDPRLVAGLATVYGLVRLVVAVPVGVWVDRTDRRSLLVAANIVRGIAVLVLAVCVHLGIGSLLLLYAVFALVGTVESAADNAAVSLVPNLIDESEFDRANSRISAAQLVADEFIGPPLGGFLFAVAASVPLFAMSGLWAAAGIIALALPVLHRSLRLRAAGGQTSVWREAVDGTRWLSGHRTVRALALIGGVASVGYMLAFSILVLFAQQQLGVGDLGYGVILGVSAVGGLVGSVITSRLRLRIGYRWTIVASLFLGAVSLLGLSLTENPIVASILLAVYICHAVVWGICATSLRQRMVPDELRGRVNASSRTIGLGGLTIGSALGGVLGVVDIGLPVAVGGVLFLVCACAAVVLIRPDAVESRPRD